MIAANNTSVLCVQQEDAHLWESAVAKVGHGVVIPLQAASSSPQIESMEKEAHLVLFDGRDDLTTLLNASLASDWVLVLREFNSYLPDFLSGYVLAKTEDIELSRLGHPLFCRLRVGVYRKKLSHATPPDAPVLYGPGSTTEPWRKHDIKLWPKTRFFGRGTKVWREDHAVVESISRSMRGHGAVPVQPGFPFALSDSPQTFFSIHDDPVQGVLCASSLNPGGWVVLTEEDLSFILGRRRVIPFEQLRSTLSDLAIEGLMTWVSTFPSANADQRAQ